MTQVQSVSAKISLGLLTLLAMAGLRPNLIAQQNAEPKRTYTMDKTVLPETVLEVVEVRHLNAENFPAELELVVKNVSDSPIYGIYVAGIFQEAGRAMMLYFGRPALAFHAETPTVDDQPLLPGKLGVLRVEPNVAKGTLSAIANGNLPLGQTLQLQFVFQTLSFGDGTGYQLKDKVSVKKS